MLGKTPIPWFPEPRNAAKLTVTRNLAPGGDLHENTASYGRFGRNPMREAENQAFENREVTLIGSRGRAASQKDVRMEQPPGMCMKTQATTTKCHA
jgi:hypothetical protein